MTTARPEWRDGATRFERDGARLRLDPRWLRRGVLRAPALTSASLAFGEAKRVWPPARSKWVPGKPSFTRRPGVGGGGSSCAVIAEGIATRPAPIVLHARSTAVAPLVERPGPARTEAGSACRRQPLRRRPASPACPCSRIGDVIATVALTNVVKIEFGGVPRQEMAAVPVILGAVEGRRSTIDAGPPSPDCRGTDPRRRQCTRPRTSWSLSA